MHFYSVLMVSILLSACTIGNGRICGFQTPAADCDKEAEQALLHPKPFVELWSKPDMTPELRMEDWIACGGRNNGDFGANPKGKTLPGESEDAAWERLAVQFQRCLIRKGYRYAGCDKAFYKTKPICGAP
jgi:hypothetical protein